MFLLYFKGICLHCLIYQAVVVGQSSKSVVCNWQRNRGYSPTLHNNWFSDTLVDNIHYCSLKLVFPVLLPEKTGKREKNVRTAAIKSGLKNAVNPTKTNLSGSEFWVKQNKCIVCMEESKITIQYLNVTL